MFRALLLAGMAASTLTLAAFPPARPAPDATPYRTDTNHSTVGFSVPILGGLSRVTGKFSRFEVALDFDPEDPANSTLEATIEAASIDTGIDARDAHLRAEDFLHTAQYPTIQYEAFEVRPVGEDELEVVGVLTMRDVSLDVNLAVRILREPGGESVGFHGTTSFDRQAFGVRYEHRDVPGFIGNEVRVDLHILTRPRP